EHPLQRRRGLDHGLGARVQVAHRLEVAGRPLAQRDRLADIDHPPVPVLEQVHARMVGNRLRLRSWAGRDGHTAILSALNNGDELLERHPSRMSSAPAYARTSVPPSPGPVAPSPGRRPTPFPPAPIATQ